MKRSSLTSFAGFAMAACMLVCQPAGAKCTPEDFSLDKFDARLDELSDAANNLNILRHGIDASTPDAAFLAITGASYIVERNVDSGILFKAILHLHQSMESAGDRERSANLIEVTAEFIGGIADRSAELLTPLATSGRYSAQIQSAREKMREWARLFSCRY